VNEDRKVVTYFTDVISCCLSTAVIVELKRYSVMHQSTCLIAAVVVGLVVAPPRVAACNNHAANLIFYRVRQSKTIP